MYIVKIKTYKTKSCFDRYHEIAYMVQVEQAMILNCNCVVQQMTMNIGH